MSLILDALRKADAERERGAVPGLHAQPALPVPQDPPPAARPALWLLAIGGLALLLVAGALWLFVQPRPMPAAGPVASPAALPPPAAAAEGAADAGGRNAPASAATVPAEPAPWPAAPSAPPVEPPQADAPPPVYARDALPAALRTQLPPLDFGGSIYSANAGSRTLIINGQLFREGDQVTADLQLEQIRAKSAVFRFRGERFELRF